MDAEGSEDLCYGGCGRELEGKGLCSEPGSCGFSSVDGGKTDFERAGCCFRR
jgi:hypothetical protein